MAKVLVVGGAGYVGSAVTCSLQDAGHEVWVLDNLSTGHRSYVYDRSRFIESNAGDVHILEDVLKEHVFETVFHFAAKSIVSESFHDPDGYHENNVTQTRRLLETLLKFEVRNFVFSSTCSVYGDPNGQVLTETLPLNPVNPYGESKRQAEGLLAEFQKRGLRSIALRYFNASGCEPQFRVGENHDPETHLIPILLGSMMSGEVVKIYGSDYPTKDGTCIRDYIHVSDLAEAHILAMNYLSGPELPKDTGFYKAFNLGSGTGHSVLEVIEAASRVVGKRIPYDRVARRNGDVPMLVAKTDLIRETLGFVPKYDLDTIISSALEWEKRKKIQKKAVFLDRDGTLNFDPNYLNDHEKLVLLPGVLPALRAFRDEGYLMYVVSNQSGVSRGFITHDQLHRIHEKLDRLLGAEKIRIEEYALCIHRPEEDCDCRKPKPTLIYQLSHRYGLDIAASIMIGDKISDVGLGINAGCKESIFLLSGNDSREQQWKLDRRSSAVYEDLFTYAKARFPDRF